MKNVILKSFDNTKISCYLWDEVKNAKGVVQLSHGMGEHLARYDHFAQFLNEKGYIVFGDDHRGHGLTENDKDRGNHKGDIFTYTVKDLVFIHNYLKEKYKLPVLFFGHSYGSFLGQAFLEQNTDAKGVAISGTAYMPRALIALGMVFLFPIWLLFKNWRPKFVNKLPDLITSKRYKEKGEAIWISRDAEIRKKFLEDPHSNISMSINFSYSMIKGIFNTWKRKNAYKVRKDTPIGIFSGDMDLIGGYGTFCPKLRDKYKKLGVSKVNMYIYKDYRHEVLNELEKEKVYADVANFFDSCL